MIRAETDCRQGCIRCIPCVAFHPSHALDDIDVLVYLLITHDKAICLKCTVLFVFCVLVPRRWHSNHSQAKALYGEIVSAQSYMLSGERADQPSNESEKDQMRARKIYRYAGFTETEAGRVVPGELYCGGERQSEKDI